MFDPYDSPLMLPPSDGYYEPEAAPEPDRIDYALEGISRFMGYDTVPGNQVPHRLNAAHSLAFRL